MTMEQAESDDQNGVQQEECGLMEDAKEEARAAEIASAESNMTAHDSSLISQPMPASQALPVVSQRLCCASNVLSNLTVFLVTFLGFHTMWSSLSTDITMGHNPMKMPMMSMPMASNSIVSTSSTNGSVNGTAPANSNMQQAQNSSTGDERNHEQDDACRRIFEWSMMDEWQDQESVANKDRVKAVPLHRNLNKNNGAGLHKEIANFMMMHEQDLGLENDGDTVARASQASSSLRGSKRGNTAKHTNSKKDNSPASRNNTRTGQHEDKQDSKKVQEEARKDNITMQVHTYVLTALRSGGPNAKGRISMTVILPKESNIPDTPNQRQPLTTVVDLRHIKNVYSGNVWHRMTAQYATWVALQTTQHRFDISYDPRQTTLLLASNKNHENCEKEGFALLPQGWNNLASNVTCDPQILSRDDVILVEPPDDGLLWDLAWDSTLQCANSDMFQAFSQLYQRNYDPIKEPLLCFIGRQDSKIRKVDNLPQLLEVMHEVFSRVRMLHITETDTTNDLIDLLWDCKVLLGVHGAGHMNTLLAHQPRLAVVEILGRSALHEDEASNTTVPSLPTKRTPPSGSEENGDASSILKEMEIKFSHNHNHNGNNRNLGQGEMAPQYFRNINMLLGHYYEGIVGDPLHSLNDEYFTLNNMTEIKEALERAKSYVLLE